MKTDSIQDYLTKLKRANDRIHSVTVAIAIADNKNWSIVFRRLVVSLKIIKAAVH